MKSLKKISKKKKFLLIGSNRITKKKKIIDKKRNSIVNCLVLPEGIESETKFFKFIRKYLKYYNNLNFYN